jgi:hypothetical protein
MFAILIYDRKFVIYDRKFVIYDRKFVIYDRNLRFSLELDLQS